MGIALVFRHFVCLVSLSHSLSHSKVMMAIPKQVFISYVITIDTMKNLLNHFYEQSNLFHFLEH